MKAAAINGHGGVEVLQVTNLPEPVIDDNEVLVRVKACALNRLDVWVRRGLPGLKLSMPHVLGCDIAGIVEKVGRLVTNAKQGDEILIGTYWQSTRAITATVFLIPSCCDVGLSWQSLAIPSGHSRLLVRFPVTTNLARQTYHITVGAGTHGFELTQAKIDNSNVAPVPADHRVANRRRR